MCLMRGPLIVALVVVATEVVVVVITEESGGSTLGGIPVDEISGGGPFLTI